jgi:hypothetical protein
VVVEGVAAQRMGTVGRARLLLAPNGRQAASHQSDVAARPWVGGSPSHVEALKPEALLVGFNERRAVGVLLAWGLAR